MLAGFYLCSIERDDLASPSDEIARTLPARLRPYPKFKILGPIIVTNSIHVMHVFIAAKLST